MMIQCALRNLKRYPLTLLACAFITSLWILVLIGAIKVSIDYFMDQHSGLINRTSLVNLGLIPVLFSAILFVITLIQFGLRKDNIFYQRVLAFLIIPIMVFFCFNG